MIVRTTKRYTICGHNEISDQKIFFVFIIDNNQMIHNLWGHETLWLNKTHIVGTKNTAITKSHFWYLQDDRTIHNLWGHNGILETIILHAFNRSTLFKIKRTFVKLIYCQKFLLQSLNHQPIWLFYDRTSQRFPSVKGCLWCLYVTKSFLTVGFPMISRCVVTCEDKEITKICWNFMIVIMAEQYIFCGHNEISHYKISFIFTIYNIIKWYTACEDMTHYNLKTCGVFREC